AYQSRAGTTAPASLNAGRQWCSPPQFTLMPTRSAGSKNRRHAPVVESAPVSARMPRAIMSRTTSAFAAPVEVSTEPADVTDTTRPGYGPGMPADAAGGEPETTGPRGTP